MPPITNWMKIFNLSKCVHSKKLITTHALTHNWVLGEFWKTHFQRVTRESLKLMFQLLFFFWIDSTEQKFILKLGFNLFFSHSFHSAFGIDRFCRYWFESRKITIKCCRQLFRSLFPPVWSVCVWKLATFIENYSVI